MWSFLFRTAHLYTWFILCLLIVLQTAYPGKIIKVEATALDQFDQSTSGFIGVSVSWLLISWYNRTSHGLLWNLVPKHTLIYLWFPLHCICGGSVSVICHVNSHSQSKMEDITFEPRIVPISPLSNIIEFQYSGVEGGENTTVVLNPFFIGEQVRVYNKLINLHPGRHQMYWCKASLKLIMRYWHGL